MPSETISEEPFDRGHVVWHNDVFTEYGRPWFVASDDQHPFHGEEYIAVGITTIHREPTVLLDTDAWCIGGLPRTSYASPWFLTTLKHTTIDRGIGKVTDETTQEIVTAVCDYLQPNPSEQ
jgi:hypothetical protein